MDLKPFIRDVPDFPKPGVLFKDITPLLENPEAFSFIIDKIDAYWAGKVDAITALETRGHWFASALMRQMRLPFVPIRKKGKLPGETIEVDYDLEYGTDTIQMRRGSFWRDARVLIVDDLLATGGTAKAACDLVQMTGADVTGCAFVVEIADLLGRHKLPRGVPIQSLITYGKVEVAAA